LKAYEGMFVFDPASAVDWSNVEAEVNRIMERAQAKVVIIKKWDERRLAYEIKGRKRGCYVLVYFRAPGDSIAGMERDAQLSEHILRVLILRTHLETDEQMQKLAEESAAQASAPPERTDRYERSDRYERGGRDGGPRGGVVADLGDDAATFAGAGADEVAADEIPGIEE